MVFVTVYIPCKNLPEARKIAKATVSAKLAACANIVGAIESHYIWKGKPCTEKETLLLLKTRKTLFKKLEAAVRKLHSYECPCICAFKIETASADYLRWLAGQTKA